MAIERDFITPAGATVLDTANVVGSTTSTDYFSNKPRANTMPSLVLDFGRGGGRLDPRIQFTRPSVGTYTDKLGVIRTANVGAPRFDWANGVCQGLLFEEQRTNFFLNENNLYAARRVAGSATGPDGKAAYAVILDKGYQNYNAIGGGAQQTFSIANGSTIDWYFTGYFAALPNSGQDLTADITFGIDINNTGVSVVYCEWTFNPRTGATIYKYASAPCTELYSNVELHPCGMYKLTWGLRYTQDATGRNTLGTAVQVRDNNAVGQFITDGSSGIQYACCQVEIGGSATTYIPTGVTAATRAPERAVIPSQYFGDWYNRTQGSLVVEFKQNANSVTKGIVCASTGEVNGNNVTYHLYNSAASSILGEVFINNPGTTQQGSQQTVAYTPGNWTRAAMTISPVSAGVSRNALCVNGGTVTWGNFNTPLGLPNVDRLVIGNSRFSDGQGAVADVMNGVIKKIAFYNTPLTDTQMQGLTS